MRCSSKDNEAHLWSFDGGYNIRCELDADQVLILRAYHPSTDTEYIQEYAQVHFCEHKIQDIAKTVTGAIKAYNIRKRCKVFVHNDWCYFTVDSGAKYPSFALPKVVHDVNAPPKPVRVYRNSSSKHIPLGPANLSIDADNKPNKVAHASTPNLKIVFNCDHMLKSNVSIAKKTVEMSYALTPPVTSNSRSSRGAAPRPPPRRSVSSRVPRPPHRVPPRHNKDDDDKNSGNDANDDEVETPSVSTPTLSSTESIEREDEEKAIELPASEDTPGNFALEEEQHDEVIEVVKPVSKEHEHVVKECDAQHELMVNVYNRYVADKGEHPGNTFDLINFVQFNGIKGLNFKQIGNFLMHHQPQTK